MVRERNILMMVSYIIKIKILNVIMVPFPFIAPLVSSSHMPISGALPPKLMLVWSSHMPMPASKTLM